MADQDTVTYTEIATGDAGIAQTIDAIADYVNRFSLEWDLVRHTRAIVSGIDGYDKMQEADALFYWVKDNIEFRHDPVEAELIQSPLVTIRDAVGDCDDMVILLAAMNKAIGNEVAYITLSLPGEQDFSHILLLVIDCITNDTYAYDPATPGLGPRQMPCDYARGRIWHTATQYQDLSGWFTDLWDFTGILRKVEKFFKHTMQFGKIYKECKRIERRTRKERNRVYAKVAKEFARWEEQMGPFATFLVVGGKVALSVVTGGVALAVMGELAASAYTGAIGTMAGTVTGVAAVSTAPMTGSFATGQAIASIESKLGAENPWELNEDEWMVLAKMALIVSSGLLTVVSGGAAMPLLIASVMSIATTGISAIEMHEQMEARKAVIKQLKEAVITLEFEKRVQGQAIAKLERDIAIMEMMLTAQAEFENKVIAIETEYKEKINNLRMDTEEELLLYRQSKLAQAGNMREQLKFEIMSDMTPVMSGVQEEIRTELEIAYDEKDQYGIPVTDEMFSQESQSYATEIVEVMTEMVKV